MGAHLCLPLSLNIMFVRSIQVAASSAVYPRQCIEFHYVAILRPFMYSTVDGHMGYFQFGVLKILLPGTFLCVF